ncbi:MAG TPA: alpha/beta hydrolase [Lachnospiraceae bacterium]|nr:alpha/beta hydrolase [Lachnospiraceae bacterium]
MFILIIVFLVLLLAFFIAGYLFFRQFMMREKHPAGDHEIPGEEFLHGYGERYKKGLEWILAQKTQHVTIKSADGLILCAEYLPCRNAVRTVLLAHGYHGTYFKDFSEIAEFYHRQGSNLLMITERAHRGSEGKYITFGVRESGDLMLWCRFLNEKYGDSLPLYLHGASMGSATVLMAEGEALPENTAGIIADCGYTSPWDICGYFAGHYLHVPKFPLLSIVDLYARLLAHFSMKEKSAPEILKKAKIPVLFVHGTNDDFVPPHNTVANYEACAAPKRLCMVDGATHVTSWFFDTEKYQQSLLSFLNETS